jgi:GNAT superfamily N-acetyltransferase
MEDEAIMTTQLIPRAYEDARDLALIREMHIAGRAAANGTYYVHCGDLDWWFNYPPDEDYRRDNIRLWEDAGELRAWCLYSPNHSTFDFFAHPAERGFERELILLRWGVDWASARARANGKSTLTNGWISEQDTLSLQQWSACGFVAQDTPTGPIFMQSLMRELEPPQVPEGFTVCDACTEANFRLRAEATHGAFGIERPWDAYWQKMQSFFHSPAYAGEHNLVVRSPDGHGTAACTIWLDPVNKVGLFEPVGTHPHFQKMGLGKAVMREGLRRMKAAGMMHAIVGTDADNTAAIALYRSMGFEDKWMSAKLVKQL